MEARQLAQVVEPWSACHGLSSFADELRNFKEFGSETRVERFLDPEIDLPVFVNEFWTSKQRVASSLHEISYRACFKPPLPRFFISRLTRPGELVYDPFMGRGTTLLEAGLLGRRAAGCDINPLSQRLLAPRFDPPTESEVADRLAHLGVMNSDVSEYDELLAFYHPRTLGHLVGLRDYFRERESTGDLDAVDGWIRMVATNRLTGHSPGFFSVYTLPPNQAVPVESQRKINQKRQQVPPSREVNAIILKKTRALLKKINAEELQRLRVVTKDAMLFTGSCDETPQMSSDSVSLVVTSPPFLDVVDYREDNWLRCWFNGLDVESLPIWQLRNVDDWKAAMTRVFVELRRILKPGGYVAFEVGEVRGGKVLMEELVVPAAKCAGLEPQLVVVNDQMFTKTANCWGVSNSKMGTNTNRIILLRKVG